MVSYLKLNPNIKSRYKRLTKISTTNTINPILLVDFFINKYNEKPLFLV